MLIINGRLVTNDAPGILTDHALLIDNGVISAIAPQAELMEQHAQVERLDARGQLIMPGNICAHTHFYGAYARGMAIPGEPARDFPEILRRLWWNLDKALDADAVRLSALVSLIDAIKHGTTTLIDHHASPNHIDGSLDLIADAVRAAGVRAVLAYEVSDRDGEAQAEAGIAENVRAISRYAGDQQIGALFGLHASLSLSDRTLRACADANPGGGFHIHVAEHEADEHDALERYNLRVIPRLHEFGILGEHSIAAHCVHIDAAELDIIALTGTWITHQPRSNMNNAVGAMRFDEFMARGVNVGIGNDGFSNNMWAEWKTAYLLHKVVSRDARAANGTDIYHAAVANNARLAGQILGGTFGKLAVGARADLILVDYDEFTPLHAGNLPWHILFGFEASMVTTTIVNGRILMLDRQLTTLDERAIMREALAHAPRVWEAYRAFAGDN